MVQEVKLKTKVIEAQNKSKHSVPQKVSPMPHQQQQQLDLTLLSFWEQSF